MKRITALALATSVALSLGGFASASEDHEKPDSATADQIRAQLIEQGYEVRKIEAEDGLYEAYAMKDGKRYEIYFDADLNVVKTKDND